METVSVSKILFFRLRTLEVDYIPQPWNFECYTPSSELSRIPEFILFICLSLLRSRLVMVRKRFKYKLYKAGRLLLQV
jgi:hypothetical protein